MACRGFRFITCILRSPHPNFQTCKHLMVVSHKALYLYQVFLLGRVLSCIDAKAGFLGKLLASLNS